jgi:major membrane immunogen (membrane-anchored lipoprotein)
MKTVLLALFLLIAGSSLCLAQCDKKVNIAASKTEYLNATGAVERSEDEQTSIEINKSDITVITDNGNHKMTGTIKTNACNWTTPFKEGKTTITTTLSDDNGDSKDFTITIEGKEGKITLLAVNKDMPDKKIRLALDKFEEKN